jgi:MOSC domain-containing protein YiiM
MNESKKPEAVGCVASLHLHPGVAGGPLQLVDSLEAVVGNGLAGDERYFGRTSRRQVSLIEREQIAEHAVALGLETIAPGAVRANIETLGIGLVELIDRQVAVGGAVFYFYEARTPCHKMDAICEGLRGLMADGRLGVMAEVVQSGRITVGDKVRVRV